MNITADVTKPVITLLGASLINLEVGHLYIDPGATASDNIDGNITGQIVEVGTVDSSTVGTYTETYSVSDAAGNAATAVIRTVNITADVTKPVITLVGGSLVTVELGTSYTEAGATATDNIDVNLTANIVIAGSVNTAVAGSYSVTYNVSDAAGNVATTVTRTVNVTTDVTKPVITLTGASPVSLELGSAYVDAGASASDNTDGDISANINTISTVNSHAVGSYSVTYNVSDAAGNAATTVVRTVNITADETAPVANAGLDLTAFINDQVTLDGTASSDFNNSPLTYNWTFVSKPAGSLSTLSDAQSIAPTFDVDTSGTYVVQLIVNDGTFDSAADSVTIVTQNSAPVADPGPDQSAFMGNVVTLDGSGSTDIDEDALTFNWILTSKPADSTAVLSDPTAVNPVFTADKAGSYEAQLTVNDSLLDSAAVTVFIDVIVDTVAPTITPPQDLTLALAVDAVGLLTDVSLGVATATDNKDTEVIASAEQMGPFKPGRHEIIWSATDSSGNTGTAIQIVDVQPLVEFLPEQPAIPGASVQVRVILNGVAAEYPVTVKYEISEDGVNIPCTTCEITILQGTEASFEYQVPDLVKTISFTLSANSVDITNATKGPQDSHVLTVIEENIAPLAKFRITQNGGDPTHIITLDGGVVTVALEVTDTNDPALADNYNYDWSFTQNTLLLVPDTSVAEFQFDPRVRGLTPGEYEITVEVTDKGNLSTKVETHFRVWLNDPGLSNLDDSDADGIDDAAEGFDDSDDDGIPDYLDGVDIPSAMQGVEGVSDKWLLNVQSGFSIRLGSIPFFTEGYYSAHVTLQQIEDYVASSGGVVPAEIVDTFINVGGYFDFEITGLTRVEQSVLVVIPQHAAIPVNAFYRKYTILNGWESFVEDSKNALYSAAGVNGICPPPGDVAYGSGLAEGDYCVQLLIEDGGSNDADRLKNGVIADPGGVAVAPVSVVTPPVNTASGGGGGSMNLLSLILLLAMYRLNTLIRYRWIY